MSAVKTFIKKLIDAPVSNETQKIQAIESWTVSWLSYTNGIHWGFPNERVNHQVFTCKETADSYATSIRKAFALTHTTSYWLKVKQNP